MSIKQIAIAILSYLIIIVLLILIVNWLLPVEPQQRRTVIDLYAGRQGPGNRGHWS